MKFPWLSRFSIKKSLVLIGMGILLVIYYFSLPRPLFQVPYATVMLDRDSTVIATRIAADGQWRYPFETKLPEKYITSLLQFEDRHFYHHPGVNPLATLRALWQNIKAGRIVSGGSTLSMQVIRLSRGQQPRTYLEKIIEWVLATRLELRYSKEKILQLYARHAPFGGNIVGLEAASWRYFGRKPRHLSWGESALLAVLPNNPSLIYPGKNQEKLLQKRNRLLDKLLSIGKLDSITHQLAKIEDIPDRWFAQPELTPHLIERARIEGWEGNMVFTSIDAALQHRLNQLARQHARRVQRNEIDNLAILVAQVSTGEVLGYVGNGPRELAGEGQQVDIITSSRSTGSLLKPFLYAAAQDEGLITPYSLLPDVPTYFSDFTPQNFSETFDGAVHAQQALSRSLNIPFVYLLKDYGIPKFHFLLQTMGLNLDHSPDHYGLSLILGGAEASLWDICGLYGSLSRKLNDPSLPKPGFSLRYAKHSSLKKTFDIRLSPGAIWCTFDAMQEVVRPGVEASWRMFDSSFPVAWKTGTSFGFRDAWAIGVTPEYVVGVWVGNADGEGRPGLTGISAAAPLLFEVFHLLPSSSWWQQPQAQMKAVAIDRYSGHLASAHSLQPDTVWVPAGSAHSPVDPYSQLIHLDSMEKYRIYRHCAAGSLKEKRWFVLPPLQEYYFRRHHSWYKRLPPWSPGCSTPQQGEVMQMVYPTPGTRKVTIPRELDGSRGRTVLEVAHRQPETRIFWHMDQTYLGQTQYIHQWAVDPEPGQRHFSLVDEKGDILHFTLEFK